MQLAIIILNYKTPQLVVDCLDTLKHEVNADQHIVIVVDNASGDGSVEHIEVAIQTNHWQEWARVLPSPVNGGFSAGNNLGMQAVDAEYYLLLNSDTLVRSGAIASLLKATELYPSAGLISPRLEWPDETPQISCFRYHTPVSELIHSAATGPLTKLFNRYDVPIPVGDKPFEPEWTSFACVLVRREVIQHIGFMDEGYFMYYDDVDYCRRARDAGWAVVHYPAARIVHLRGGSGPVKEALKARKRPRSYLYASRSRYFAKFYGPVGLWTANAMWLLGRGISALRELIGHKQPHTCEYEERDIWMNWRNPLKPALIANATKGSS
jgi:GT2 family glycosyltransferase